jgi:hypothetical protein
MATFDVVPTDPADPNRPFSAFGRCDVVGLRYGPRMLQFAPELADRDVIIVPGMEHACDSDVSVWQGVYSELYALWQTDAGELLREGDGFVVMGPGWRFVVSGVHVLPVDMPEDLRLRVEADAAARKEREYRDWKYRSGY